MAPSSVPSDEKKQHPIASVSSNASTVNKSKTFVRKMERLKGLVRGRREKHSYASMPSPDRESLLSTGPSLSKTSSVVTPETVPDANSWTDKVQLVGLEQKIAGYETPNRKTSLQKPEFTPTKEPNPNKNQGVIQDNILVTQHHVSVRELSPSPRSVIGEDKSWDAPNWNSQQNNNDRGCLVNSFPPDFAGANEKEEPFRPTTLEQQFDRAVNIQDKQMAVPNFSQPTYSERKPLPAEDETPGLFKRTKVSLDGVAERFGIPIPSPDKIGDLEGKMGNYVKSAQLLATRMVEPCRAETFGCSDDNNLSFQDTVGKDYTLETKDYTLETDFDTNSITHEGDDVNQSNVTESSEKQWIEMRSFAERALLDEEDLPEQTKTCKMDLSPEEGGLNVDANDSSFYRYSEEKFEKIFFGTEKEKASQRKEEIRKMVLEGRKLLKKAQVGLQDMSLKVGQHFNCSDNVTNDLFFCAKVKSGKSRSVDLHDRVPHVDSSTSWLSIREDLELREHNEGDSISKLTNPRELESDSRTLSLDLTAELKDL